MEFRIADTFTDSLARLSAEEQKAVKTTAFDLQVNPASPGMQLHRLEKVKDRNFWSVRAGSDIRIIVHRTEESLLLCYVDHHDKAYLWAERRKLQTHPKTGAAQLVEIREMVQEVFIPKYVEVETPARALSPLFTRYSEDELLSYGVPPEWLPDVLQATEGTVLELAARLPAEAAEALLNLAVGVKPQVPQPVPVGGDPFKHPDAQRRFRVMSNLEELERALDSPWDKWTIFLHPAQRELVEREYNGPARVAGTAGTGKTIVALHRAVFLARANPDARVLLTTFSDPLANALRNKLRRLISNQPQLAERLEVHSMEQIAQRLYGSNIGKAALATEGDLRELILQAGAAVDGHLFSTQFLLSEWNDVVDAWQLKSWEEYRDVARLGRKTRLPEKQRTVLWDIFGRVRNGLSQRKRLTASYMFTELAAKLSGSRNPAFDFVVVDEAQDVSVAQLRFLAALGAGRPNSLFFAGDLGQRIFQQPFSWKAAGVDVRGRSRTLRINYRTSHQIRQYADRLLAPEVADVDGNVEERKGATSVFNGPPPSIRVFDSSEDEIDGVAQWLTDRVRDGLTAHEVGVFVRSAAEFPRARAALDQAGLKYKVLDERVETTTGYTSLSTMHLAKGLEFRAVVVMACDDEVIPLQERIETVTDDGDLKEVYETERHLLYVACTRARDHLLVTASDPGSEFLDDLKARS